MKRICFGLGLLAVTAVSGQQKETVEVQDLLHFRYDSTMKMSWTPRLLNKPGNTIIPLNKELKGQFDFTLMNGDQVYRLPVDRMPCVKPGNQYYYTMPVRTEKVETAPDKPGAIPNPVN